MLEIYLTLTVNLVPTGEDALTPDIGAMFYYDNNWEARNHLER